MRLLAVALFLTVTATASAAPKGACAIEQAVYRLKGFEASATLRFVDDPKLARQSHLSAVLKSNVTGRTYKFRFAASNGYSTQYLLPVHDGDKDETTDDGHAFYMFDAALRATELPNPGGAAPRYLFVPTLGPVLWYSELAQGQTKREAIETQMWQVEPCAR
ncbi:MAG: hypothetical protein ABL897_06805 [Hyphomicrobium sp.]|nr:hypothetical protein [Alphaproteobacteria bacterium]